MYKNYNTNQLTLPMDIQVLIPQEHFARLIDFAVDQMNLNIFLSLYPGGGHGLGSYLCCTQSIEVGSQQGKRTKIRVIKGRDISLSLINPSNLNP